MEIGIQVSSLKPLLLTPEQVREAFARMAFWAAGWSSFSGSIPPFLRKP